MKRWLLTLAFILLAVPAWAQLTVTFAWDASATPSPADNPIKYKLYTSASPDYSSPTVVEAGTALEVQKALAVGRVWVWCTAYYNALVDGLPTGPVLESDKSNVLQIEVFAPPGRPDKPRIKSVVVIGSIETRWRENWTKLMVKQAE